MIKCIFALVLSLSGAGTLLAQDAPVRENELAKGKAMEKILR